ncbi:O-antigen ligase family protein [Arenibaculum sp.]|jgi:O-antigen ligase|uniref:O-antigen ligase family protein n=1 Tax=Arenibaculum sp. TaxID=2865862 RepID=UPI002E0E624E|nr:O-antigen ligase family protein [Arenibaculum sp.]
MPDEHALRAEAPETTATKDHQRQATVTGIFGVIAVLAPLLGAAVPRAVAPLLIVGGFAAAVTWWMSNRRPPPVAVAWIAAFAALIVVSAMSTTWAPDPDKGRDQAVQFLLLFTPALALASVAATLQPVPGRFRLLPVTFAAGGLLLLFDLLAGLPLYNLARGQVAFDGNPNDLNRNMVVLAAVVWPAAMVLWTTGRPLAATMLPLGLAVPVMLGESQSAQLGLIAGVAALALAAVGREWTRRAFGAVTVLVFLGVVPAAMWLHDKGMALDLLPPSARHRLDIWHFTAGHILEKPLFGWGLEASRELGQGTVSTVVEGEGALMPLHPHNAFLQIWLELGAVGVASVLVILLLALRGIGRMPEATHPPVLAAYAAGMAMVSISYGIWQSWWLATLLLTAALIVAVARSAAPQPRV